MNCQTQEEIDELWEKLSEGGEKGQCGWLKDKYGLSWQIVPTMLGEMMQDQDPEKTNRVMGAILQMKKLDIKRLQQAFGRRKAPMTHLCKLRQMNRDSTLTGTLPT